MSVFIDPPVWPAHGTTFSHLVSDVSLAELHEFALLSGLAWRAFDLDHFDVPAKRYDSLVAAGARAVSANDLTRRLIASGIRVPRSMRGPVVARRLIGQWHELLPGYAELGQKLVDGWGARGRYYHDLRHLDAVLRAIDELAPSVHVPPVHVLPTRGATAWSAPVSSAPTERSRALRTIKLAAWFHDAVYMGSAQDEAESAAFARAELEGAELGEEDVAEVERLILLTQAHDPHPADVSGQILCDADLAVLALPWQEYERYIIGVRSEYAHVPDADFVRGRADIVRSLQQLPHLFNTETGRRLWESPAQDNLAHELDLYTDTVPTWLSRTTSGSP